MKVRRDAVLFKRQINPPFTRDLTGLCTDCRALSTTHLFFCYKDAVLFCHILCTTPYAPAEKTAHHNRTHYVLSSSNLSVPRRGPSVYLVIALCVLGGCAETETKPDVRFDAPRFNAETQADSIRQVLAKQVEAWNQGDIEGFMERYQRSDTLRFASGGDVRMGWQATLDAYRKNYPDRATMGTLDFRDLDVRVLSPTSATAFGRWRLRREEGLPESGGLFTLLFEKSSADAPWRIVHDHTSAADVQE